MEVTGRYTSNLEDLNLLARDSVLPLESQDHLSMEVVVGAGGHNFSARVR